MNCYLGRCQDCSILDPPCFTDPLGKKKFDISSKMLRKGCTDIRLQGDNVTARSVAWSLPPWLITSQQGENYKQISHVQVNFIVIVSVSIPQQIFGGTHDYNNYVIILYWDAHNKFQTIIITYCTLGADNAKINCPHWVQVYITFVISWYRTMTKCYSFD